MDILASFRVNASVCFVLCLEAVTRERPLNCP